MMLVKKKICVRNGEEWFGVFKNKKLGIRDGDWYWLKNIYIMGIRDGIG